MKLIFSILVFMVGLILLADYTSKKYKYMLPENFSKCNVTDTLQCVKDGGFIKITFKNKTK